MFSHMQFRRYAATHPGVIDPFVIDLLTKQPLHKYATRHCKGPLLTLLDRAVSGYVTGLINMQKPYSITGVPVANRQSVC